ncbi:MAG: host-nuclease inhibitor Gam family protein [Verrucomicrobiae bacterium]|nr:host-nuclease inhibitor Gam family protein [Verrucomicrobiae bacterium]
MKKTTQPTTRDEAVELLGQIRAATINLRHHQLDRESRIKAIDDEFRPRIESLQEKIESMSAALESWAESNPAEFGAIKSIECAHGRFGFRICPPAARCIRPFTWAKVLEMMERDQNFHKFIRTKKEVDREALISARESIGQDQLKKIGVRIEQDEIFFIEPRIEEST